MGEFIKTNQEYGRGVQLDEYNGVFSLIAAREGTDGKIYKEWAFPQDKDRRPRDKAIPVKVDLGDKDQAIEALLVFLRELGWAGGEAPF